MEENSREDGGERRNISAATFLWCEAKQILFSDSIVISVGLFAGICQMGIHAAIVQFGSKHSFGVHAVRENRKMHHKRLHRIKINLNELYWYRTFIFSPCNMVQSFPFLDYD